VIKCNQKSLHKSMRGDLVIRNDLAGSWELSRDGGPSVPGRLPGCQYLDLIANGMEDPLLGSDHEAAAELARHAWTYSRTFEVTGEELGREHIDLVADGVDTVCDIFLNENLVAKTDNINRLWRFDVKGLLKEGTNGIRLAFADPFKVIAARQAGDPLPKPMNPLAGVGHLRKTPCHFGWDWGPCLPPAGVSRSIALESYDVRISDFIIRQIHENGSVRLLVRAELSEQRADTACLLALTAPGGETVTAPGTPDGEQHGTFCWDIPVVNPLLWWCSGLGDQPLYDLSVTVSVTGKEEDCQHRKIGLRTIALDTSPDQLGHRFCFVLNGVPVFAKGANWIPNDSFPTRGLDHVNFLVESARRANMNMLRVWGGGAFESEAFYDACDRLGILVWQDFPYACNPYPFHDGAFLENVRQETQDNVRRLRHRASLALWCGNNEAEVFFRAWGKSGAGRSNPVFYHETLPAWLKELDPTTPYWPGSPSSGSRDWRVHNLTPGSIRGDTHLWQIWHGLQPYESFRNYPTRFCSEFGMESLPSMRCIRSFGGQDAKDLSDPVLEKRQKCSGGNEKLLWYLLTYYRYPESLGDLVYLTQLVQADTVRFAAEHWRSRMDEHFGALFWQLNDCWPVLSWSGIDHAGQYKAVMYHARHFHQPVDLICEFEKGKAVLTLVNETRETLRGEAAYSFRDFSGREISGGTVAAEAGPAGCVRMAGLGLAQCLKGADQRDVYLEASFSGGDSLTGKKTWLLVRDRYARLPKASVQARCEVGDGTVTVRLTTDCYARRVYVESDLIESNWSDNFFDIVPGREAVITARAPGSDADTIASSLRVKCLTDVVYRGGPLRDSLLRASMMMKKFNWLYRILFKILLH